MLTLLTTANVRLMIAFIGSVRYFPSFELSQVVTALNNYCRRRRCLSTVSSFVTRSKIGTFSVTATVFHYLLFRLKYASSARDEEGPSSRSAGRGRNSKATQTERQGIESGALHSKSTCAPSDLLLSFATVVWNESERGP